MIKTLKTKLSLGALFIMAVGLSHQAQANGILAAGCITQSAVSGFPMSYEGNYNYGEAKLYKAISAESCKSIEKFNHSMEALSIGIMPIGLAALVPGVKQTLATSMYEVGAMISASPVVASVAIMTGTGLMVAYVVLRISMMECKSMNSEILKQKILEDLYKKHGIVPSRPNIPIQINDGVI